MATPVTVLIPCKNEIQNISACIASARRIASEVLVADSGSNDGTLQLARRLADRVIEREYIDSGNFKNWGIPQAEHKWVLILDADERVTPELAAEVREVLDGSPHPDAYSVPRRNFFLGHPIDHGDWARDRVIRLIRRDRCRYGPYTDHAEIEVDQNRLGRLESKLDHYTAWDLDAYVAKLHRYAHQQACFWRQHGKRPKLRHIVFNAPFRFLRGYFLRFGFLDGTIGFLIASLTAYYSFLKQFFFWQRYHGRSLADIEPDYEADWLSSGGRDSGSRAA